MAVEPENTLRGFRRALETGCAMIEVDVHLVEGTPVVMHDFRVDRTTDGEGELAGFTLVGLRGLDAGKGEKVPLLEEMLELCAGSGVMLNIELKGRESYGKVLDLLEKFPEQQVIVSSFDWPQLEACRRRDRGISLAVLVEHGEDCVAALLMAGKLDAVAVNVAHGLLKTEAGRLLVAGAHAAGSKVYAFTVKTWQELAKVLDAGCDGAFVNDPEKVLEWLARARSQA